MTAHIGNTRRYRFQHPAACSRIRLSLRLQCWVTCVAIRFWIVLTLLESSQFAPIVLRAPSWVLCVLPGTWCGFSKKLCPLLTFNSSRLESVMPRRQEPAEKSRSFEIPGLSETTTSRRQWFVIVSLAATRTRSGLDEWSIKISTRFCNSSSGSISSHSTWRSSLVASVLRCCNEVLYRLWKVLYGMRVFTILSGKVIISSINARGDYQRPRLPRNNTLDFRRSDWGKGGREDVNDLGTRNVGRRACLGWGTLSRLR